MWFFKSLSIIEGQPKFWPAGNIDLPSNRYIFTWLYWAVGCQILQADMHIIMSYSRVTRDWSQSPHDGPCASCRDNHRRSHADEDTAPHLLGNWHAESVGTTDSRAKPPNAMKPMKKTLHREEIAKIKTSAARTSSNIFMCDLLTS